MYYKDLTEYNYTNLEYSGIKRNKKPVCVGWLGREEGFVKGKVSEIIVKRLLLLCLFPRNLTRGYHVCEFCPSNPYPEDIRQQKGKLFGKMIFLGNGEIHIQGKNNRLYIAPTLIVHYISVHNYKPPQEFIDTLSSYSLVGFNIFLFFPLVKDFFIR